MGVCVCVSDGLPPVGHSVDFPMGVKRTVCSGWCPPLYTGMMKGEVTTSTHNGAPRRRAGCMLELASGTAWPNKTTQLMGLLAEDIKQGRVPDSSPLPSTVIPVRPSGLLSRHYHDFVTWWFWWAQLSLYYLSLSCCHSLCLVNEKDRTVMNRV